MLVSLFCETEISFIWSSVILLFIFPFDLFSIVPQKIHPYAGWHLKRTETCLIFCWSQSINQPIARLLQVLKTRLSFTSFFKVFIELFYNTTILNCLPLQELHHVSTPKAHLRIHASPHVLQSVCLICCDQQHACFPRTWCLTPDFSLTSCPVSLCVC